MAPSADPNRSARRPAVAVAVATGRAVGRHPELWGTAVRQVRVLAPRGWWRRPPFLPVPDRNYLAFRLQTAYGDGDCGPDEHDIVTYLHWCRAWPRVIR